MGVGQKKTSFLNGENCLFCFLHSLLQPVDNLEPQVPVNLGVVYPFPEWLRLLELRDPLQQVRADLSGG